MDMSENDQDTGHVIEHVKELIEATELRTISLVSIDAVNDSLGWPNGGKAEVTPGEVQFRSNGHEIHVRFEHNVTYQSEDDAELAHIVVVHVAIYTWEQASDHPDHLSSPETINKWIEEVVYFTIYPYVRSSIQSIALSMGIPPVILGYLRRDLSATAASMIPGTTFGVDDNPTPGVDDDTQP